MRRLPRRLDWLFWDVDPRTIDLDVHERAVIPRVLERGRLAEVRIRRSRDRVPVPAGFPSRACSISRR